MKDRTGLFLRHFMRREDAMKSRIFLPILLLAFASSAWPIPGDANGDGLANISDAVYLINHTFKGGEAPVSDEDADMNCDNSVDIADAISMIAHVFRGGPLPGCFPFGEVTDFSDCGGFGGAKSLVSPQSDQECIEYTYGDDNVLHLFHSNATFNCCPGQIITEVSVRNDTVFVAEDDLMEACRCICPFDVMIDVERLVSGQYTVYVTCPWPNDNRPISFPLDATAPASGVYCIEE
jgi:hypothetical protein